MPSFRAHSLRFYQAEPSAIVCLAHSASAAWLAAGRADGVVEVWSTRGSPVLEARLVPGPGVEASVESLAWCGERLFSCGLHGQLVEYDLDRRVETSRQAVTSGPAWCLAADKAGSRLACGTEEGFVCLFRIVSADSQPEYERVLDRQEGRILCLAWHPAGMQIATGSADTVRVWDTQTGHPTARMTTGRTERHSETIVWCVAYTSDHTVISGDSRGKTSFWDGRTGSLVDSVQSHKADVLALAVSQDETTAYSTGVDPTLMHFQVVVKGDGRRKWVKSLHRVISSHDVRAVVVGGEGMLYSGGVDSYLGVSQYPAHRTTVKLPHLPRAAVGVASQARTVLLSHPARLEVWRLGTTNTMTGGLGAVLPLDTPPAKLLEISVKSGETVLASAIHPAGAWLAYSTTARLRLLQLKEEGGGGADRISISGAGPALLLALYSMGETEEPRLLVCPRDEGGVVVYSVEEGGAGVVHQASTAELGLTSQPSRLVVAGERALLADRTGTVVCLDLATHQLLSKLPSYSEAALSSLGLAPSGATALLAYSDNRLVEVDTTTGRYTQFGRELPARLPRSWLARRTPVNNVVHIAGNEDVILMHDHGILATLDKDKEMPEPSSKLFFSDPRSTPDTATDSQSVSSFGSHTTAVSQGGGEQWLSAGLRVSRKYEHLVSLHHLAGDEIVAVEVRPASIEALLPPSLKQKKFGGS